MIRNGRSTRAIALALALLLLAGLVVIAQIGQNGQKQIGRIIDRSQQRQILVTELLHDLAAAEAGQRGFLLTNDAKALAAYRVARDRVAPTLARLTTLFYDDVRLFAAGREHAAMDQLRVLSGTKLGELAASLALYSAEGPQQAMTLMRTDFGSPTMSEVSDAAATLREAEQAIVDSQLARAERLQIISGVLMGVVALFNVMLLIVAATLLGRQARRRAALTEQLARVNEELELRVRRRTAELSALSSHLQQLSEKEKATLARELHDELGGLLIAVKMDASWLHKRWPNPAADIQARWLRVLKVLDDGVDFKRRIVENLRPTLLDNMGLLPAVRWITQETCSRAGLQYSEIYPEHEPPLNGDAAIMLFRLVQESLINIVKHAHATHVRLQLTVNDQEMSVLIEDNGIGIDTERREAIGSHGLATMRHRVRSYGGRLDIESVVQGGTRVCAHLPLTVILKGARATEPIAPATDAPPVRAVSSQR